GSLTYIVSGAAQIDEEGKITGPAGTYTVTVEDHGCSAVSIEFTLAEQLPTPEAPKISIIDPTCEADGYAQIEGYDSELTYTFNSEDVSVDADGVITGPAGDYTVTVTNAEGCASDSASFTVEGMLPTPKITVKATSDPTTCSGEDGSIGLTFTGIEDGSYEMSYGGGSFGTVTITDGEATITGLSAGSYMNIRVTNTDDCTSDENVNVTLEDPEAPE